eukprot:scaffold17919_cov48-Cyclotella_meneghiniana.AAC.2
MPSRKKERGRARRAAKKASVTSRSGNNHQNAASKSDCDHLDIGTNWQQGEYDLATNLAAAFELKYRALKTSDDGRGSYKSIQLVDGVYDKYFNFSDGGKELFRKIIIARGTEVLVNESKETEMIRYDGMFHHNLLMKTIEVRDEYNGDLNLRIRGTLLQAEGKYKADVKVLELSGACRHSRD